MEEVGKSIVSIHATVRDARLSRRQKNPARPHVGENIFAAFVIRHPAELARRHPEHTTLQLWLLVQARRSVVKDQAFAVFRPKAIPAHTLQCSYHSVRFAGTNWANLQSEGVDDDLVTFVDEMRRSD